MKMFNWNQEYSYNENKNTKKATVLILPKLLIQQESNARSNELNYENFGKESGKFLFNLKPKK